MIWRTISQVNVKAKEAAQDGIPNYPITKGRVEGNSHLNEIYYRRVLRPGNVGERGWFPGADGEKEV